MGGQGEMLMKSSPRKEDLQLSRQPTVDLELRGNKLIAGKLPNSFLPSFLFLKQNGFVNQFSGFLNLRVSLDISTTSTVVIKEFQWNKKHLLRLARLRVWLKVFA
jgi:hypothetical protein